MFKRSFKRVLKGGGVRGFRRLWLLFVALCFFLRPGSTVHCIYGFSPPPNPGQKPGQKSDQKSGWRTIGQRKGGLATGASLRLSLANKNKKGPPKNGLQIIWHCCLRIYTGFPKCFNHVGMSVFTPLTPDIGKGPKQWKSPCVQPKIHVPPEILRISYFLHWFLIFSYFFLGFPINRHPHVYKGCSP